MHKKLPEMTKAMAGLPKVSTWVALRFRVTAASQGERHAGRGGAAEILGLRDGVGRQLPAGPVIQKPRARRASQVQQNQRITIHQRLPGEIGELAWGCQPTVMPNLPRDYGGSAGVRSNRQGRRVTGGAGIPQGTECFFCWPASK